MKLSRRQLAQSLAGAATIATLSGQNADQSPAPAQGAPASARDQDLRDAQTRLQATVRAVESVELPMATEPATRFEAEY